MKQWCVLSPEMIIPRGQFAEAQLQPLSGMPLHKETSFLNEWARLLMDRYESEQPTTTFLVVENVILTLLWRDRRQIVGARARGLARAAARVGTGMHA